MPKLRYEINILNGTLVGATTASEAVNFDPGQYSGTLTFYFEVVASITSGSANVTLQDPANSKQTILTVTATTPTLTQSGMTTPSAGMNYYTLLGAANVTIKAARIVIYQDTGGSPLAKCENQYEIGSRSSTTSASYPTGSTNTNQTNPKYWYYDSTKFDGTLTIYFECCFSTPTSKSVASVQLQVADGTGNGFTGWSNVTGATMSTTATAGGVAPIRTAAITLTSGRWYRLVSLTPTSKSAMNVYSAKIIIQQSAPPAALITQSANTSNTSFGGAFAGSNDIIGQTFTPGSNIVVTSIQLQMYSSLSPTDAIYVQITTGLSGTVLGTSANVSGITGAPGPIVFNFSTPVSLTASTQYAIQFQRTGGTGSDQYGFGIASPDPYPPGALYFHAYQGAWSLAFGGGYDLTFIINGYTGGGGITKTQPEYLILNTLIGTGTALQKQLMNWNPNDWSGVSNSYSFQVTGASASSSALNLFTADGNTLVAVLSSVNYAASSTATMPSTAANLDIISPSNNNDTYSASLVVTVSAFNGTQVSPAKATLTLTAAAPVVLGAVKLLSPTSKALAISAKTPTVKVTTTTQMTMIL